MHQKAHLSVTHNKNNPLALSKFKDIDEQEIWDEFRKGNRGALVYIYQLFKDDLFTYGYQFSKDKEIVKDHIQELFLYLFKNAPKLGTTNAIKFYLYKSLRRLIAKDKTGHIFTSLLTKEDETNFRVEVSQEVLLIEKEERNGQLLKLKEAINKLPLRQREIIFYFFYEGFSYKEIQTIMGYKDIQTVRNLQYRALKALKDSLGDNSAFSTEELFPLIILLFQFF